MLWKHIFGRKHNTADDGLNEDQTNDRSISDEFEAHGESAEESKAWRNTLTGLEDSWSALDLDKLWSINRTDLNKSLKHVKDSTPSDELFSIEEQEQKRTSMLAFLERNFLSRMMEELPVSWWDRVFAAKTPEVLDWDYVKGRFANSQRAQFFENEYKVYVRKKEEIEAYKPSGLFDNNERASRIFPQTRKVREEFSSHQRQQYKLFNDYIERIGDLPFDEIDDQLSQVADDYQFLGRSREWFAEYANMIREINSRVTDVDEGQNESIIRLLQNDFLVVMQNRFSHYWRFHELKDFCEKKKFQEVKQEMEAFEAQLADMEANNIPALERTHLLQEHIKSIESQLARDTEKKRSDQKQAIEALLTHDHKARLTEWADFKQNFSIVMREGNHHQFENDFDDIAAFNALRPILRQCSEWQHELRVFRSTIKSKRSMDTRRRNSDLEHRDVENFLHSITRRVEAEITTDVDYRSLEQELVKNKEHMVDLIITRKQLALEKQLRSAQTPEVIHGIKREFVKMIWEKRGKPAKDLAATPRLSNRRKGRY